MIQKIKVRCEVEVVLSDDTSSLITVVCDGKADITRENYGADADGNRGVMTTFAEDEEADKDSLEQAISEVFDSFKSYDILSCEFDDYE